MTGGCRTGSCPCRSLSILELVEKCSDPDRGDGRKGVRYGIGKQDALSDLDGAARIDDVRDIAMALRGRGLDERYARAPEHARGIVLVEQNRDARIMAYGADAMGEGQPTSVRVAGGPPISALEKIP